MGTLTKVPTSQPFFFEKIFCHQLSKAGGGNMELNEKAYLKKTLQVVENKIEVSKQKFKETRLRLKQGVADLSDNFYEERAGGDLSNNYSSLSNIEYLQDEFYRSVKRLNLQKNSPYFARIDFKPEGKTRVQHVYIGLGTISENQKLYVADWRAPISSMYYDYSLGDASYTTGSEVHNGEILLKRQYKIENGQLLSYFDTDLTINDEILQEILSHNVSVKMKQIVSTIQKEQNSIVRQDTNENILVQGIAGSGKTSIVLHRAAYLLYKHRGQIKSSDIQILSPNNVFSSYIAEVLPQLGEDNLVETTFAQIARAELKRPIQSREAMLDEIASNPKQEELNEISYKSSYEYLDNLLRFLKGPLLETFSPKDLSYVVKEDIHNNIETIDFPAEQTKELFFKTFKGLDLYERINKIAWQYAMVFTEARHYTKEQNRGLRDRFKKILYTFFPIRDIDKIFEIFMARENLKLNKRPAIDYMDKGTYLAIKYFFYGFDHDFSAKYLIIDEMQDFTPVDIYLFKKLWHCPCIVVGDVNQSIEKNISDEYLQITADFLGCKLIKLNKTYRSTKEIAKFANSMIGLENIDFVNRHGQEPTVYQTSNQAKKIKELIDSECSSFDHIAIICKCNKEAKALEKNLKKYVDCSILTEPEDYNNSILITTCATAKGIEFDAVIIPNAEKDNYHNTIDKNILYVSSTRALHKLFFVSESEPSTLLSGAKLVKE